MYTRIRTALIRAFPVPQAVAMPAAGVDISDHSVKVVSLTWQGMRLGVDRYGSRALPDGVVENGEIKDRGKLVATLRSLKETFQLHFVRASLPEERGYLFSMDVPCVSPEELYGLVQFQLEDHIPITASDAIFDYHIPPHEKAVRAGEHTHIAVVSAFPKATITEYQTLFEEAGLVPVSFEIEAQAVARAVVHKNDVRVVMIVDFGKTRSGITIVEKGAVRFTTTIDVGGDSITRAIHEALPNATDEEVVAIKNERGIVRSAGNEKIAESLMTTVSALKDEMNRHALYWHGHEGAAERAHIAKILMCGGSSNLAGLVPYLGAALKIPVSHANVWENVFSVGAVVPPIVASESLGYAHAIGLALEHLDS